MTEGKFSLLANIGHTPIACTPFGNHGEIEDGTEIGGLIFDRPNPGMKFKDIELELVIALWYGKRDEADPDWTARGPFDGIMDLIVGEVEHVVKFVSGWAR